MKILFVPSWYPSSEQPLNGSFFREQALMLQRAGHELIVLVPRMIPVQRWRGADVTVSDDNGLQRIEVALPALPRPLQRYEDGIFGHMALRALRNQHATTTFDVIHAHSVQPGAVIAKSLSIALGIPYVVTEHRPSSLERKPGTHRDAAITQAMWDADGVATVSAPFAEAIRQKYVLQNVEVTDLPVPESFAAAGAVEIEASKDAGAPSSPSRPWTVLHISHLNPNKRAEETLEAFAALEGDHRLLIAGGSEERVRELRSQAVALGVTDRVELLGQVEREHIPALLSSADTLILASAREAGGTVLSEALSLGLDLVVTDTWAGVHAFEAAGEETVTLIQQAAAASRAELVALMAEALRHRQALFAERSDEKRAETRRGVRDAALRRVSEDAFVSFHERFYRRAISRWQSPSMVFHAPYPLDYRPAGASRLRPKMMHDSFGEDGYRVRHIMGEPRQRAYGLRDLRRRVSAGDAPQFLYSENSTQPNLLATSIKNGLAPLLEARIFSYTQAHGIPTGEFYRDVYWRFPRSQAGAPLLRRVIMALAYRFDVLVLRRTGVHLFLPSAGMAELIPIPKDRASALPPGTMVRESKDVDDIHIFYVGGLGSEYGLHECLKALRELPDVTLTLCVQPNYWEKTRAEYEPLFTDRVRVVHAQSHELQQYYDQASLCLLFVEPSEYRKFAVPVKFFEYLGYGKPAILSEGTLAGELGSSWGIGLSVPYSAREFEAAVRRLQENPEELRLLRETAKRVRHEHTWLARAREVGNVLSGKVA